MGSEIKSLLTMSSKSEGSTPPTLRSHWRNAPLHERCSISDMIKLKEAFDAAYGNKLFPTEFRELLQTQLNVEYDDDEFKILFMKINTNCNGEIVWDELVSHLALGHFSADAEGQREALQLPIMGLPHVMRSMHRHPISRICFCPDVSKKRTTDPMQGMYLTASRDGMINWWTLDMTLLRTAYSTSPQLKVRTTWVTDMACLPDVNIVATSSTERDLRFYDCTARTFTLKIIITSWEYMICSMHYHFSADASERCLLAVGDSGGHVRVLSFSPEGRGPFQNRADRPLVQLRYIDLQRKCLPELRVRGVGRAHGDWVRQVAWYAPLRCVVSCATCRSALHLTHLAQNDTDTVFYVDKGVQCFAFDPEAHVLATGGPDCTVRVWSPFVSAKPGAVLVGHHAGVVYLVLQNSGQTVYSLARDRVIKVWDVHAQTCIQTYVDVPSSVGERTPLCAAYNAATRALTIGAVRLALLTLDEPLSARHSDGLTHARAVAAVLYNPLFKVVVTCGQDSIIINWDPLTGSRNVLIREAHTLAAAGEVLPAEVTAACFHHKHLLLLTGARTGELKVWNFNTGVCLRSMHVERMCEITGCFWVEGRILAVGWNRHVTEFEDTGLGATGKAWETRHRDDVLCAAARAPLALATAAYNSELVLWKLETGQPYRQFSCTDPMLRIKMQYTKREAKSPAEAAGGSARRSNQIKRLSARESVSMSGAMSRARARRVSAVGLPPRAQDMRQLAAHAMLFLTTRPVAMNVASLLVSLENGSIQCWSEHPAGGFQGAFQGVHTAGDYVAALATDERNQFLFTGTTVGYIKVWLMTDYLTQEKEHVSMPRLRLEFPFLWRDRIEGRAKRCVRAQPLPLLLNSYRAHLRCVTALAYLDHYKLLVSGSADYSARVWRLSGEYVRTLGGAAPPDPPQPRFPPDVAKVASFTTFKVWRGGRVSRAVPGRAAVDHLRDITAHELATRTYGAAPAGRPLGRYWRLPARPERAPPPALDASLPTTPLYCHLRLSSCQPLRRPRTPPLVAATRLRQDNTRKARFDHNPPLARDIHQT